MWARRHRKPENTPEPDQAELELAREEQTLFEELAGRPDVLTATMAIGESRRAQADQLIWQIPALGLTAQAFLSTVIFSGTTSNLGRLLAAITACVFVGASLQSLLKHRYDEGVWSRWLKVFETAAKVPRLNDGDRRNAVSSTSGDPDPDRPSWLFKFPIYLLRLRIRRWELFGNSAFRVWALSLVAVLLIDICLFFTAFGSLLGWWQPFTQPAAAATQCVEPPSLSVAGGHGQLAPSSRSAI